MRPSFIKSIGISAFVAVLAFGTGANAQSDMAKKVEARLEAATKKIRDACIADVQKFCGQVTPGEGRLVMCMMAHEDKVSDKCDVAIYEASRNLERAVSRIEETADACWPDIEKNCVNTPPGGGRVAQCLMSKKASLTKDCAAALDKFPALK